MGMQDDLVLVLRMLARKGAYQIFLQIKENGPMYYNDVLNYALEEQLFKSRASVTVILNCLTDYGLLDRMIINARPSRTQYSVNDMGDKMLRHLEDIKRLTQNNS